jgi:UDP-N-acetylmuramoyl-tripeptide--D-alanyl-D-alanine ligase
MKNKIALVLLKYFRLLAKIQLLKNKDAKIIGITGTAGKTSTRDAVKAVLSSSNKKAKSKIKLGKKANSESGIPLNILGLEIKDYSSLDWLRLAIMAPIKLLTNWEKFDFFIVEMAIDSPDEPKNMSFLLSIVRPQLSIFLNAGLGHSEPFDHLVKEKDPVKREKLVIKEIAKEKGKLVTQLDENGFAILNFDDQNVKDFAGKTKAQICSIGKNKSNDISLIDWQVDWQSKKANSIFKFQIQKNFGCFGKSQQKKSETLEIKIKDQLLAEHYSYSFASAIAVGLKAGLNSKEIKKRLEQNFKVAAGRCSILAGKKDSIIIDSSYNASSMAKMIDLVNTAKNKGRRIAVLGDIRELGDETAKTHQEIAKKASKIFDIVFLLGPAMNQYAAPILEKSEKVQEIASFDNSRKAGAALKEIIKKDDLIFFKASQNTLYLEEAIEQILKNPEDKNLLCRQDYFWTKSKDEFFKNL